MFEVVSKSEVKRFPSLSLAMDYAKGLNEFVTIKGASFEAVGIFGVDGVSDGLCPDGVEYGWRKRRK